MKKDKETSKKTASLLKGLPDPDRALKNLERLFEALPEGTRVPWAGMKAAARLFSFSQFLANHCIANPEGLFAALLKFKTPLTKPYLDGSARQELSLTPETDPKEAMAQLRNFKKHHLLGITLRDLSGETDIIGAMDELTALSETVVQATLKYCIAQNEMRFGEPERGGGLALVGLGKLGGEELNYSSDVDLMAVFGADGHTRGVVNASGVRVNRISHLEFHSKVMEQFCKVLSSNTEQGVAYRVDLRLRPQGKKGPIAQPLSSFRSYYELWGRTWERMALIRARPVAGDPLISEDMMEVVGSFVWRGQMDYTEIEEIRAMKRKIDSFVTKDDIKRGYGGIREAEFFVHTFQLIYGPQNKALRSYRMVNAIQGLRWLGIVPEAELVALWEHYLFLRKTEHYLQMRDDLQTHTLPKGEKEREVLARKMGFATVAAFDSELKLRRAQVKNMYNSLLGTREEKNAEAMALIEGNITSGELSAHLSFRGVEDPERGAASLKRIREAWFSLGTREHGRMREAMPELLNAALEGVGKTRALSGLEGFLTGFGLTEAHLAGLMENRELASAMVSIFAQSSYLSRVFLSSQQYLNLLIEEMPVRKGLARTARELQRAVQVHGDFQAGAVEFKRLQELRLGGLYLSGVLDIGDLMRYVSHLAEAVLEGAAMGAGMGDGFAVVAMGKLGGREISFGSDLDVVFVSESRDGMKAAEKIIKTLTAYTDKGLMYSVDARLRPDGSKGVLVKDLKGYRDYYLKSAHGWEIQALLKCRPVTGPPALKKAFMEMALQVIRSRGPEIKRTDMVQMRRKIVRELAHKGKGFDIKFAPGALEEIEFYVQWLQLSNAQTHPGLMVQNTACALGRLVRAGIITAQRKKVLLEAYYYYHRLAVLMKLNDEKTVITASEPSALAAACMGHTGIEGLLEHLSALSKSIIEIVEEG